MKKLLEINMFWGLLILSVIQALCHFYGTSSLNRTIGWGWDITNLFWWSTPSLLYSMIVFTIGYGILYFSKRKTRWLLSLFQIILLLQAMITPTNNFEVSMIFVILNWIVFRLNIATNKKN